MYKNNFFKGKIIKRMICLILSIVMSAAAAGCGSPAASSSMEGGSGNNTLTISVITKDMYLDTAVKLFQEQHPGITVDIREYTSNPLPPSDGKNTMVMIKERPEDVEKYVGAVNTQLMSGKGPDIMLLSPLPYENYIDKNMLADLSGLMDADKSFDTNKYYTNIFDAMKHDGNLYGLPLSISLDVLEADKALLEQYDIKIQDDQWTWENFEQIAENIVENSKKDGAQGMYALSGMDGSMLISSLVSESFDQFVNKREKTAGFDSPEFVELLNSAKFMIDKNYIDTDTSQEKMADLAARGNTVFSIGTIRTYMDLMMAKQVYGDGVTFLKYPGEGNGQSFTVDALYGINDKSPNKALAWEFLKFLVSDDMMSQANLAGLPVNREASLKAAENAMDISQKMSSGDGNGKMMLNLNGQRVNLNKPLTREDVDLVENLLSHADKYTKIDRQVLTIVQEETKAFFEGGKTAGDTAKTIQDRVNTYINE